MRVSQSHAGFVGRIDCACGPESTNRTHPTSFTNRAGSSEHTECSNCTTKTRGVCQPRSTNSPGKNQGGGFFKF